MKDLFWIHSSIIKKASFVTLFFSFGSLLIFFGLLVSSAPPLTTSALTDTSTSELTMTLDPAISVAVPNNINLSFTPSAPDKDGHVDVHTASGTVAVYTNNATGYTLSVKSNTDSTDLTNSGASSGNTLAALSPNGAIVDTVGSKAIDEFEANKWGYLSSCTTTPSGSSTPITVDCYRGVTNGGANIKTTSSAGSDSTTFTVGAKADLTRAPGKYTGEVMFSAVTNPPPPTWETMTEMQQMTSEICASQATPSASATTVPTKQLIDTRDNKPYWISKLADGNCWMVQNLDLNITTAGLTAQYTDIQNDWNASSQYPPTTTMTDASLYTDYSPTTTNSWDAGDYFYDGTTDVECGSAKLSFEGCPGFSTSGNQHYHVGNMYSWNAATAGTGGSNTSSEAIGSICPKGWRLPGSTGNPSYAGIKSSFGYSPAVLTLTSSPYYFVRVGRLWYDGDQLIHAGDYASYWTSTSASSSLYAYDLTMTGLGYIEPALDNKRGVGMAVRCVAR